MKNNQTSKWFIDAVLFAGFFFAFFLDLTGLELHQWIGVAAVGLAAYHLVMHGSWVGTVAGRFFGKTNSRARLYFLLDLLIFAGFAVIGLTGIVISSWLDLTLGSYNTWLTVHIQASILILLFTVVKIGLHWRWIVSTTKKIFTAPKKDTSPFMPAASPVSAAPSPDRRQIGRRDFIKMMGTISVASAFALSSASFGLRDAVTAADGGGETQFTSQESSGTSTKAAASPSSQSCSVRCERQCPYPGNCHRYTDSNGNNRCDFGECA